MALVARLVLALALTAVAVNAQSAAAHVVSGGARGQDAARAVQDGARVVQDGAPVVPDVFQVVEIPLTLTNPLLVRTKNGYLLKCSLANSSEYRELGFRYSIALIDTETKIIVTRSEGFRLAPDEIKIVTFRTPLKLSLKGDERLVLMVEQLVSTDYVWEVIQAKEALMSYANGDYSTPPRVLRVLNQVDARPLQVSIPY